MVGPNASRQSGFRFRLDRRYVDRLQPFGALKKIVKYGFAFLECAKPFHLNGGMMDEYIRTTFTGDESIALLIAEPLDHSLALFLYFLLAHFHFLRMGLDRFQRE